jgi:hypothetical protein
MSKRDAFSARMPWPESYGEVEVRSSSCLSYLSAPKTTPVRKTTSGQSAPRPMTATIPDPAARVSRVAICFAGT